ncbi:hypothetical protein BDZ89DRAFT_1145123 [Hymenopellis radicata]|nr:hypothetical protein BDZ89DRAFT_1145123 [Hymenopellis radicata]
MISSTSDTIFVDGAIRHVIVDGLQKAFPLASIVTAPPEVRQLRERKSEAELELMKCANEQASMVMEAMSHARWIPPTHQALWNQVHGAQNTAFQTAKAGVVAKEVDQAARLYFESLRQ